jgi:transcriptional regulator with XRE-family HTH domain
VRLMSDLLAILSKNLKRLRATKGLTQESLADACDLHRTYIGALERGERNISLRNLEKIARALGVSAASLIVENEDD